jgi:lysocardiolipin and lysophospholipid acyltransferase
MLFKQIFYIVFLFYWLVGYNFMMFLPSLILKEKVNKDGKKLSQIYVSELITNGFNSELFIQNKDELKNKINKNPELVDIIISNHISSLDFIIILAYLKELGITDYNFVMKDLFNYVPGIGFMFYLGNDIRLRRNWDEDKFSIIEKLKDIQFDNNKNKQIILIFPEGARLTTERILEGQKYSQENGYPIYNNLMVPRTKGLWLMINELSKQNMLGKVWDLTLVVPKFIGKSAFLRELFNKSIGPVYTRMVELDIPKNETQYSINFKNWLFKTWKSKDIFIDNYFKFEYDKLNFEPDNLNTIKLITISTISLLLLNNKYGRYYLFLVLIITYIMIIFKV